MISIDALHLGPLMIPWMVIIILIGLFIISILCRILAQRQLWPKTVLQTCTDSLWSSVLIGLLAARIIFVALHFESYQLNPIDILKIQDKGFHLWGGVAIAMLWFWYRNRQLKRQTKGILLLILSIWFMAAVMLKQQFKIEHHYPDLSFPTLLNPQDLSVNTQKVALKHFTGQPTVINLWASWCPPCHREMPVLQAAAQHYPHVHFVMLNQGEDIDTVHAYLTRHHFNFKHVLFDAYGEMPQHMQTLGLPSTLFFNAEGQLVERHLGELSPAMLQLYLQKISTSSH